MTEQTAELEPVPPAERRRGWARTTAAALTLGVVGLGGGWLVGMVSNAFTTPPTAELPSELYAPATFSVAPSAPPSITTTPRTAQAPKPPVKPTPRTFPKVIILTVHPTATETTCPSASPSPSPTSPPSSSPSATPSPTASFAPSVYTRAACER